MYLFNFYLKVYIIFRYLVIVESSIPDAFKALIKIRDFVLTAGYDFDLEKTKELLYEYKAIDQDIIEMLSDKNLQTYERYCRARELVKENILNSDLYSIFKNSGF